jgi:AraC-like DNA-binding protein
MQNINGTEYHMPTYTLTVMHNHDCHRYYDLSPDNLLYNLSLLPSLLPDELLKKLDNLPFDKICVLPEPVGKTVLAIMDALVYSQDCHKDYPANFAPMLCRSLVDIFLHHYTLIPSAHSNDPGGILQNSLIYINAHYTSALQLNEIAEYAKCCPSYLSEHFHKKMDMTIKQYINVMRLKHAKKLLITTDLPIMSICFECGFSSLASFNRNFLENEKISPSAYRKSYHSNVLPNNSLQTKKQG